MNVLLSLMITLSFTLLIIIGIILYYIKDIVEFVSELYDSIFPEHASQTESRRRVMPLSNIVIPIIPPPKPKEYIIIINPNKLPSIATKSYVVNI
jgi:hypothetical protein